MNNEEENMNKGVVLLLALGCLILSVILSPMIVTLCLWLEGWIATLVVGEYICSALAIFGLSLMPNQIPYLFIAVGWIGYAFSIGPDIIGALTEKIYSSVFGEQIFEDKE